MLLDSIKTVKQEKNSLYSTFFHDNILLPASRKRAKSLKVHPHGEVISDNWKHFKNGENEIFWDFKILKNERE